ncbi:MAG: alginate O-acetyltransferase complex protein AlgI [Planctomycetota bacterium]|jgi:alginate O-acetyltransferase complex protein AlgI
MLFNSWGYLLFLLAFVPLHWILPSGRGRIGLLGLASVLFYGMWRWEFCFLVLLSAVIDFYSARRIHASEEARVRKSWLALSLCINLGLLVFFKYTYFLHDNVRLIGSAAGYDIPALRDLGVRIILPLGISFYTFQTISYTIDIYRRVAQPTRSFWSFLTYVTFWPQLIAGPVLRASEVIPQLEEKRSFDSNKFFLGLQLIILGLFKKVVLADSIAPMVDEAFAQDVAVMGALDVWVSTFLFGFQIYFDFAGYSSIALGSALLVGLTFPANFNWPYLAKSPREFWQRWHISLSSWIRDYLYLPLTGQAFRNKSTGGLPVSASGTQRNRALLMSWLIMGLWHGSAWTFVFWGLYHALLILIFRGVPFLDSLPKRLPLVSLFVMLPLGMAGWIFFRAESLGQALTMYSRIVDPRAYGFGQRAVDIYSYLWAFLITLGMLSTHVALLKRVRKALPWPLVLVIANLALAAMICGILVCMGQQKQFIYFQF